ncbi:hypothetical protein [Paenibacillus lentus]|uniref:ThuA-like domain-containing protein n=1 Tax=Paenibacillus lentus TaxID=1338368 RepID=A0A3Q8S609_9BACL|nr:hypothetical protein [Paenibacillus lentus]AZK48005.1 hypothetical protein EIM92_19045 [Paenibacillus lentus]
MRKIAVIYGGNAHQHRTFYETKYRRYCQELIYLPELHRMSLDDYDVVLIPSQLHQRLLMESQSKLIDFVQRGGVLAGLGAQPTHLLPGHGWEFRPTNFWWWLDRDASSGLVANKPDHDLFNYITLEDATWHYHGVFHPPAGVDCIINVEGGGTILYVDQLTTSGTLILTTLDPEYHYGSYFMPATERFLNGFLPWLAGGKLHYHR